jgi:hypothetical protein
MLRIRFFALIAALAATAIPQMPFHRATQFEQQPALTIANDRLEATVSAQGGALVNLVLRDDPESLSPLWNPIRMARELGQPSRSNTGSMGNFVCVDGFGPTSQEERAAGLPGHGEAQMQTFEVRESGKNGKTGTITLNARLPLVQENFTRTFRMVDGENVIYVESALASEVAFDRPISWAEHTTIGSPFLQSGVTLSSISGSRAQNRPYQGTGNPGAARRLASGVNFTWPLAPGLDGKLTDLTAVPENAHYLDHATVLVDPTLNLGWVATVNTARRLIIGYVFKREEYPWVQNWGNFPANGKFARGLEFSTQPYDEPRRLAVATSGMFDAPTFRWLPAKSTIRSHFLLFYARTPDGFGKVISVRLENGRIAIEDSAKKQIALTASLPL